MLVRVVTLRQAAIILHALDEGVLCQDACTAGADVFHRRVAQHLLAGRENRAKRLRMGKVR